ncbi:MAG: hypothetical protein K0Q71_5274 [Thermomicrobiales bacterium]|nr:hypothetical protein [Thermomicrobiales bacterium]
MPYSVGIARHEAPERTTRSSRRAAWRVTTREGSVRQQTERRVAAPGVPCARLVLARADLALRLREALLDLPAALAHAHQLLNRRRFRAIGNGGIPREPAGSFLTTGLLARVIGRVAVILAVLLEEADNSR